MRVLAALALFAFGGPAMFQVSAPATIVDLGKGVLKGDPVQLAWSPEGQFYIQTVEGQAPKAKFRHYVIAVGDKGPKSVGDEPKWAAEYWAFKSTRNTPARPDLMIEVQDRVERNRLPTQSLSQRAKGAESGGGAIALQGAAEAANDYKNGADIRTLVLGKQVISTIIDGALIPGVTFGWSPAKLRAVAYVDEKGRLGVYEYINGADLAVPDTKDVLLPAWSPTGDKIVFLQRTGRHEYSLQQVNVSRM
jgi:hypothetical protein